MSILQIILLWNHVYYLGLVFIIWRIAYLYEFRRFTLYFVVVLAMKDFHIGHLLQWLFAVTIMLHHLISNFPKLRDELRAG